uniref:Uncharacterized protein n=1 Tax=Rhizophora mucronata TaxID=61149 RepID=A0A2P2J1D4_RHIMU
MAPSNTFVHDFSSNMEANTYGCILFYFQHKQIT